MPPLDLLRVARPAPLHLVQRREWRVVDRDEVRLTGEQADFGRPQRPPAQAERGGVEDEVSPRTPRSWAADDRAARPRRPAGAGGNAPPTDPIPPRLAAPTRQSSWFGPTARSSNSATCVRWWKV